MMRQIRCRLSKFLCWIGVHDWRIIRYAEDSMCGNELIECFACGVIHDVHGNDITRMVQSWEDEEDIQDARRLLDNERKGIPWAEVKESLLIDQAYERFRD